MFKNKTLVGLLFIFIFGLGLRLIGQFHFSASLNWDEASLGYNAYSLAQTGADEWGTVFPTIFRAFGDYKLPLYVYLSVVPVKFLGLTAASTRLASELAGAWLILVTFLIVRRLRFNSASALLSAALVAIEPWSLFLSKIALEANLTILFISLGICLLLYRRILLSLLFFGLSVWGYNSARVFTPVFLFSLLLVYRQSVVRWARLSRGRFTAALFITCFFFGTMGWQIFSGPGLARFGWLSLVDSGAVARIENLRRHSALPDPWVRFLYNRPVYFITESSKNYFRHFLPDFLFINGGSHYQFNIPATGLLYRINLPFFYLGIFLILKTRRKSAPLICLWLFLAPLAGSITRDSPHTLRAVTFLPLPMILSGLGVATAISALKKYWWFPAALYLAFLLVSFRQYYFIAAPAYRTRYSQSWQYGHSQLVAYLRSVYQQYDRILITKKYGEPHIFILFNWPWPPAGFRSDPDLNRYSKSNWYWVDSFAKFRFINDWEMVDYVAAHPQSRTLIVASPENIPSATELDRLLFLDGQPAFILQTQ